MRAPYPLVVLGFAGLTAGSAQAGDLTLRRVMLSTGGVGYFEYAASVDGAATLGLDLKLAQVDDVLQSIVVFDSAGAVGSVELAGAETSRAAFAGVPFGPQALASAGDFLNSLQGVTLEVAGPRPMRGRLLRAEAVQEPLGGTADRSVARTRVTLVTATGLQQFVLEEAESVQVADDVLRQRIDAAIEAVRGAAAQDTRHLTLHSAGSGARELRVGYVAGAPLWKTTYRLVLPASEGASARLQGWAVLENDTGADWNGVELALQYGNPVTFRQALYRSYYVTRPEVPVEVLGRILPGVDSEEIPLARMRGVAAPGRPPPSPAPAMAKAADSAEPMRMAEPEEKAAASEQLDSTVFRLATPLMLPAGHSATVPILDHEVPAERLGVVREDAKHPLQALRVSNDTAASLPAGVLTLYDPASAAAFAGDARLGGLPAGQTRLLEFAEDLRTAVDWHSEQSTSLLGVTAAQGVLHVQNRDRWTVRVALVAPADEPRRLLLEIPRRGDGTLVTEGTMAAAGETANAWRVPLDLRAGETRTVVVHVDRVRSEATMLAEDSTVLAAVLGEQGLTPLARAALRHVVDLRTALSAREAERDRARAALADAEHDEDRVRRNLAAVPAGDALHGKLVHALDADEDRVAAATAAIAQAEAAVANAHAALDQGVQALRL